jgi:transcription-repair coupling factor (superfamily II helicase)
MRNIPIGLEAVRLHAAYEGGGQALIYLAADETRAEAIGAFLAGAAPGAPVVVLPSWDCLPYDSASPSRAAMGRRMRALRSLAEGGEAAPLVVATPEAALQRVPPPEAIESFALRAGDPLDLGAFRAFCARRGYVADERVDEPGEVAIRGEVIDIFPAAYGAPCRIERGENGRVVAIRRFDPATQRSTEEVETLAIDPATESPPEALAEEAEPGAEHRLGAAWPRLATLFDYAPRARVVESPGGERARERAFSAVQEAWRDRQAAPDDAGAALPPEALYLTADEWEAVTGRAAALELGGGEAVPAFARERRGRAAFLRFLEAQEAEGRRVVLAGPSESILKRIEQRLRLGGERTAMRAASLADARGAGAGVVPAVLAPLEAGFVDRAAGLAVVAAADLLGSRAALAEEDRAAGALWRAEAAELHLSDLVVHLEHGVGSLRGTEPLDAAGATGEAIRLEYANDGVLLAPAGEAGKLWRYGSAESDVRLDRIGAAAWEKRRAKIAAGLAATARALIEAAEARADRRTRPLRPADGRYERLAERFPYPLTPGQRAATEAALADMAGETPMNRLVVGDVGFGKTEVALRAAAAAAFAGAQVAVIAPTTVLARQHHATFARRFAGLGVEVAHLSRLTPAAEARRVRQGLAEGAVGVVVGTHALLGKAVRFDRLGLLVIDEEQRFGAQHKRRMRSLGEDVHVLTMTATPIPRTLQGALAGVQDLSVIATPPLRRRPIRTLVGPHDEATLRQALLRERRRGGQSFVVAPRIDDVEGLALRLEALLPGLRLLVAHGRMKPRDVDEAMLDFASGRADVLVATSIIESGLDVPRANTMVVLRPDLFGLAQLHQLRGRVGRGHLQARCHLMTDPDAPLSEEAQRRLGTLQALDRLGAGMAIAMHDLDQRGAGELFGERQAGHVRLIGLGLYQDLLAAAVRAARGEPDEPDEVAFQGEAPAHIPTDYVPEPIVRINLYHRLARTRSAEDVEALSDEILDRFGPPPAPVERLFDLAAIRAVARSVGVTRIAAGSQGVALTFRPDVDVRAEFGEVLRRSGEGLDWNGERLLHAAPAVQPEERLALALDLLRCLS